MSQLKVYRTRGKEVVLSLSFKNIKVKANFTNGNTLNGNWATLSTKDPTVQFVIEHSPLFNREVFISFIGAEENIEGAVAPKAKSAEKVEAANKGVEILDPKEIDNITDAVRYLVDVCGVKRATLSTAKRIAAKAEELGVSFPKVDLN